MARAEAPAPPLSAQARILWDALIETPPQIVTSDFYARDDSYRGSDSVWDEFLAHPQVRERLLDAAVLAETRRNERNTRISEELARIRSLTGLTLPGAEQIRADYRRVFQTPRPLSPRERHMKAERMARTEFESRYPDRSPAERPEYRREYSDLLNRFELELENERTRNLGHPSRARATAWARRWQERLQSERTRLIRDGLPILARTLPDSVPPVMAIPLTPEIENHIHRKLDHKPLSSLLSAKELLQLPSAQPEILDFQSIQTRFPESLSFSPLIPGGSNERGLYLLPLPQAFSAEDQGNPRRRWLFFSLDIPAVGEDERLTIEALRQGSFHADLYTPTLSSHTEERPLVTLERQKFFLDMRRNQPGRRITDHRTTPTFSEIHQWLGYSKNMLESVRTPMTSAGASESNLHSTVIIETLSPEKIRDGMTSGFAPEERSDLVNVLRFRQAELDRVGFNSAGTTAAVQPGGLDRNRSLPLLLESAYVDPHPRPPSLWNRVSARFRGPNPSPGSPASRAARSANVPDAGSNRPLYYVRGETDFLDLIDSEDLDAEKVRAVTELAPAAKRSVFVSSVEGISPSSRNIALPTPHEHRLSEIELIQFDAGRRRTLVRGTDYTILENLDGSAASLRLAAAPAATQRFEFNAQFVPGPHSGTRVKLPEALRVVHAGRLQALSEHLRDAGFVPLADRVARLAYRATTSRGVSVQDLRAAFHEEGRYTFGNTQEGMPDPDRIFRQFAPFLDVDGRSCMVCGPTERFFTLALHSLFEGEPDIRARGRMGFQVSDSASGIIRGRDYHARTELTFGEHGRLPLDATPAIHHAENLRRRIAERLGLRKPVIPVEAPRSDLLPARSDHAPARRIRHSVAIPGRLQALSAARSTHLRTLAEIREEQGRSALPSDLSDPSSVAIRLSESLGSWLRADISLAEFDQRLLHTLSGSGVQAARTPSEAIAHLSSVLQQQRTRLEQVVARLERDPHAPASLRPFRDERMVESTRAVYSAAHQVASSLSIEAIGEWFDVPDGPPPASCPTLRTVVDAL